MDSSQSQNHNFFRNECYESLDILYVAIHKINQSLKNYQWCNDEKTVAALQNVDQWTDENKMCQAHGKCRLLNI